MKRLLLSSVSLVTLICSSVVAHADTNVNPGGLPKNLVHFDWQSGIKRSGLTFVYSVKNVSPQTQTVQLRVPGAEYELLKGGKVVATSTTGMSSQAIALMSVKPNQTLTYHESFKRLGAGHYTLKMWLNAAEKETTEATFKFAVK